MITAQSNPFAPSERMLRQFAALWIFFFSALAALQGFRNDKWVIAVILAALAVTIGPLGLVRPSAVKPIFIGWMTLAYPIGWVVSRIILGVLFFALFTPFALVFRIIGRDALGLKTKPKAETYWCEKPGAHEKSQYLKQF
jgi:hypothetical protein